jgi:hypothetical protein
VDLRGTLHLEPNPFGLKFIWHGIWVNNWAPLLQMGQQMGPFFANGPTVGPLSVKSFDPFQGPISYGLKFCNWDQGKPWPIFLLRPKVLVPNLRHVDRHVGYEEIWVGPQCKALGPILTTPSNPIDRNLNDLGWHPFGPSM